MAIYSQASRTANREDRTGQQRLQRVQLQKTKKVSYSATQSDQIFSISELPASSSKENMPKAIELTNVGSVPLNIMVGYETYTNDTTANGVEYLHTMLSPGQRFTPLIRGVIATGADTALVKGTAVNNQTPSSDMYLDSGADVKNDTLNNTNDPVSFGVTVSASANSKHIRVGDLIQVENEVLEVLGTYEDDPTNSSLVAGDIRCARGKFGTTNAVHSSTPDIRFPFFNAYHDKGKFTTARTDANGKFLSYNFFGLGRAGSGPVGITPGSVAFKFFNPGWQSMGLSGITPSTDSGLGVSTTYYFKIALDGGSAQEVSFTTDSSNVNFGGANGIMTKINAALAAEVKDSSSNLFEKTWVAELIDGDIRFTSRQNLSTSAVVLTAGTSGAGASVRLFSQQNGRIPALANLRASFDAKLDNDIVYDSITYEQSPNSGIFAYDNGNGLITGMGGGRINYETGEIDLRGAPVNADFVFSCLHTSAFSGRINESQTDRENSIKDIYVNTPSQKWNGSINIRTIS